MQKIRRGHLYQSQSGCRHRQKATSMYTYMNQRHKKTGISSLQHLIYKRPEYMGRSKYTNHILLLASITHLERLLYIPAKPFSSPVPLCYGRVSLGGLGPVANAVSRQGGALITYKRRALYERCHQSESTSCLARYATLVACAYQLAPLLLFFSRTAVSLRAQARNQFRRGYMSRT